MREEIFNAIEDAKGLVWEATYWLRCESYQDLFNRVRVADTEAKRLGIQEEFRAALTVGTFNEEGMRMPTDVKTPDWYIPPAKEVYRAMRKGVDTHCPVEDIPVWIVQYTDWQYQRETVLSRMRLKDIIRPNWFELYWKW